MNNIDMLLDQLITKDTPTIAQISTDKLHPFPVHPFKVQDDEDMEQLTQSIQSQGVLTPLVVRPLDNSEYEVISGHRRLHACKKAGIQTVPALVYTDPTIKNSTDLVMWAEFAHAKGWGYVWGTYGDVLDKNLFEYKKTQYPDEVGGKAEYIESNWLGGRTADCVGLIKGYGWFEPTTNNIIYATNGMPDIGADDMYNNATEKGTIDTIPEIPGLAVWHEGHIGIYIGNGEVIRAANTNAGVIKTPIGDSGWTHWLKIPYITYAEETEESTE